MRSQFRRQDEAETLNGTDFVLVDDFALTVLGDVLEARQVADSRFHVGMAEDQEASFNRGGCEVGRRSQNRGDLLGVVGQQRTGNLAQHVQADGFVGRGDAVAAAVERVGSSLQFAVTNHLTHQTHALAALLLHFGRNVIFVHIDHLVGHSVEAGILLQHCGHVGRGDGVSRRRNAFSGFVVRGERIDVRSGDPLVIDVAERQVATEDDGVRVVLRDLLHLTGDAENFNRNCVRKYLTFELANPLGRIVVLLDSHLKLLN